MLSAFKCSRITLALALGLTAFHSAQAIIVKEGSSPEAAEAASHLAGAKHTSVAGLVLTWGEAGHSGVSRVVTGTAVYLGTSQDKKKGLALTAAHLFGTGPTETMTCVALSFGPVIDAKKATQVGVQRVLVHPDYRKWVDRSAKDVDGSEIAIHCVANDIAILEFDAAVIPKVLEPQGIQPAPLYDGKGYTAPLLMGEIVGFGKFGTRTGGKVEDQYKVHSGHTRVTYGTWRGQTAFMQWTPISLASWEALKPGAAGASAPRFELVDTEGQILDPLSGAVVPVRSHPNQALVADGDSGGPLFFNSNKALRVAGICSSTTSGPVLGASGEPELYLITSWEPVKDHLPWIREVEAGKDGKSRVLTLPKGGAAYTTPVAAADGKAPIQRTVGAAAAAAASGAAAAAANPAPAQSKSASK